VRSPRTGSRVSYSRALLCAGFCGKPALPALLGRGVQLAGSSGYWVGHSGESFAVELIGPGAGLRPAPGDFFCGGRWKGEQPGCDVLCLLFAVAALGKL
jgi:hypothetical protein